MKKLLFALSSVVLASALLTACAPSNVEPTAPPAVPTPTAPAPALNIPIEYYKLPNGLRVVLTEDRSLPLATIGVYYNIGFRIEPKDRTGFAHLFEHMMFQGSANLGKNEFYKLVQGVGGQLNGSTRFDFTNYYEAFPSNALETMLWAEADRMRSLKITKENLVNQQGVVKEEVKVNVLNRRYGGFPWLDLPQYANQNWYNAHNFYGDLEHIDAATLEDVQAFFDAYYTPNNAVLVVAGDFEPGATKAWIAKYFGSIPARTLQPQPDISEPPQTSERRVTVPDARIPQPALALGYHAPERLTPEHFALGMIDEILLQGQDSRLHREIVQKRGFTERVDGGINVLGNMFNYKGPTLWTISLIFNPKVASEDVITVMDEAIDRVQRELVTPAELERARTKVRANLYNLIGSSNRFGLVDLLACFALFDDDPNFINRIEAGFAAVTPETVQSTAQKYLRRENRTILLRQPTGEAAEGK